MKKFGFRLISYIHFVLIKTNDNLRIKEPTKRDTQFFLIRLARSLQIEYCALSTMLIEVRVKNIHFIPSKPSDFGEDYLADIHRRVNVASNMSQKT